MFWLLQLCLSLRGEASVEAATTAALDTFVEELMDELLDDLEVESFVREALHLATLPL